jgi:hypothetical protein
MALHLAFVRWQLMGFGRFEKPNKQKLTSFHDKKVRKLATGKSTCINLFIIVFLLSQAGCATKQSEPITMSIIENYGVTLECQRDKDDQVAVVIISNHTNEGKYMVGHCTYLRLDASTAKVSFSVIIPKSARNLVVLTKKVGTIAGVQEVSWEAGHAIP